MRRRPVVTALAAVVIPLLLPHQRAVAQGFRYEYAGKIVCGPQPDSVSAAVVRGYYATSVNVRNASPGARAIIKKWVVWTYPTERQVPETPVAPDSVRTLVLSPRNAFTSECRELEAATKTNPNTFHEGFFYVWSDQPLDVIGLYTAANLTSGRFAGQASTMHIDRFTQRSLLQ
jgi:hypothetical protein